MAKKQRKGNDERVECGVARKSVVEWEREAIRRGIELERKTNMVRGIMFCVMSLVMIGLVFSSVTNAMIIEQQLQDRELMTVLGSSVAASMGNEHMLYLIVSMIASSLCVICAMLAGSFFTKYDEWY